MATSGEDDGSSPTNGMLTWPPWHEPGSARSGNRERLPSRMKVRDILRLLERDGWFVIHHRSSHRLLKHPTKPGRAAVAGHPGDTLPPGTLNSIMQQAALRKRGRP